MDEYKNHHNSGQMDLVFSALGHGARRKIVQMLAEKDYRVTELANEFDLSLNVVSKHIKVLERARLVKREKEGRVHRIRFDAEQLKAAADWISRYRSFWEHSFDTMSSYVNQLQNKESGK